MSNYRGDFLTREEVKNILSIHEGAPLSDATIRRYESRGILKPIRLSRANIKYLRTDVFGIGQYGKENPTDDDFDFDVVNDDEENTLLKTKKVS